MIEEELLKRDQDFGDSTFKPIHSNFLRKSSSKALLGMGKLARDSSHESLNDRGSTVYMTNTLPAKRRASQYDMAARADKLGDNLRNLNYSQMYQAPKDEILDRKLLKSPSKDSEGFKELNQQLTEMGASIEKIVPTQKQRNQRPIKGNSISHVTRQLRESQIDRFYNQPKLAHSPSKKFSSATYGRDTFYESKGMS